MEPRVTVCPSPSPSHPGAAPSRVPGRGCTHPCGLPQGAGPPVARCLSLSPPCSSLSLPAPGCCRPCVSLSPPPSPGWFLRASQAPSSGLGEVLRPPALAHGGDAGGDPVSLKAQTPAQPWHQPWGLCGTYLHPSFCVHLLSKPSVSLLFLPFLLFLRRHVGLCIVSAKESLTRLRGGARSRPLLIFTLNNWKSSLAAAKTQAWFSAHKPGHEPDTGFLDRRAMPSTSELRWHPRSFTRLRAAGICLSQGKHSKKDVTLCGHSLRAGFQAGFFGRRHSRRLGRTPSCCTALGGPGCRVPGCHWCQQGVSGAAQCQLCSHSNGIWDLGAPAPGWS